MDQKNVHSRKWENEKKDEETMGRGLFLSPLAPYVPLSHQKLIKNYMEPLINLMALYASLEIPPMHKKASKSLYV